MRAIIASLLLLTTVGPVFAQGQVNPAGMSCAEATALLKERGAVVFDTGPGEFSRFVLDQGSCEPNQVTEPAWLRTADQPQCLVGQRCIEANSKGR